MYHITEEERDPPQNQSLRTSLHLQGALLELQASVKIPMGEFMDNFGCLKPSSLPFGEMDASLDMMSQLVELSGSVMDNASSALMSCQSNVNFFPDFWMPPFACTDTFPVIFPVESPKPIMATQPPSSAGEQSSGDRKRKMIAVPPDTSSASNSGIPSETVLTEVKTKKKNSSGSGKRGRSNSKKDEKPREVVHVRARRGQATDSHSLAERVRREKINERMRCLQDLVPGCYKTMGMAGVLDEIINYVQSLQNQIEFLSMKLSAASSFCDYSLEATPHQVGNAAYEAQEQADILFMEGYGGGCSSFHTQCPFEF